MSIFSRIGDIAGTNFADFADRADDPERAIRRAILEMDEALVDARANAARVIADQKELARTVAQLDAIRVDWIAKAGVAMNGGRDDLAKAALFEAEKADDRAERLSGEVAVLERSLAEVEADIALLTDKLTEARLRQATLQTRYQAANSRTRMREAGGGRTASALSRFADLDSAVDLAEGCADAAGMAGRGPGLEQELGDMSLIARVDARFAALKAERAAGGAA